MSRCTPVQKPHSKISCLNSEMAACLLVALGATLFCNERADVWSLAPFKNYENLIWEGAKCPNYLQNEMPPNLIQIDSENCCFGQWAVNFYKAGSKCFREDPNKEQFKPGAAAGSETKTTKEKVRIKRNSATTDR